MLEEPDELRPLTERVVNRLAEPTEAQAENLVVRGAKPARGSAIAATVPIWYRTATESAESSGGLDPAFLA